jgi:hypothetical protein
MATRKKDGATISGEIHVGNISNAGAFAIGHQSTVTSGGPSADAIAKAFAPLMEKVEAMPAGATKEDAKEAAEKLVKEARQGEAADESRVRKWLNFLAETSSDAWEVAIATMIHPVAGVSTIFQKIAQKAKEEQAAKNKP